MIDQTSGAPSAEDPSVTIGGVKYSLRVGTLAGYELSEMNIEPGSIFTVSDRDRRVTSFAHILKLFRALIAHNFVARHQPVPTPQELAMMLDGAPSELLSEISEKTLAVMFPKLAALTKTVRLQETAPTSEPLPN